MKINVTFQTVRRKWGHVIKWKNKIKWCKLKENEEKWNKWRKMKENEGHNCFH